MTTTLLSQLFGDRITPQKEEFWAYEHLVGYPVNRNPDVGSRLDWSRISPHYEVKCFADDWAITASKRRLSSLGAQPQGKMIINPRVPIVAMDTAFFLQHLDELMFYSRYSALVWTDDKACVLECSQHNLRLYANFQVA